MGIVQSLWAGLLPVFTVFIEYGWRSRGSVTVFIEYGFLTVFSGSRRSSLFRG